MKKITLFGCLMAAAYLSNAQSPWLLGGNTLTGGEFLGSDNAFPLIFKTNNNTVMEIDTDGNVGIGVTPGARLTVISGSGVATPNQVEGCTSPPETWASYGIYSSIESGTPYNRAVTGYIEADEAQNIGGFF